MKRAIILLAVTLVVVFCTLPVNGGLITIEIEAVVDSVRDERGYLEGKISPGDLITGSYRYESTTADSNPLEKGGRYEHTTAPHGIFLSVGGFDFETDPGNVDFLIEIENDHPPDDNYLLLSRNNLPLSNGVPVDEISWWLTDPSGTAAGSTDLPTAPPVLDDWQSNILAFGADRRYGIFAHVTSAVPEPATIMLVGIGAVFLRKRS